MFISSTGTINVPSIGRLPAQKGITVMLGSVTRKPVMGNSKTPLGYTEEYEEAPGIKCTLSDTKSLDKTKLQNIVGETITLMLDNGQQFVLNNAYLGNSLELDLGDGKIEVEFFGEELIQQA